MKKIIHLSDLHIGHEDCEEKFLKIIDYILNNCQPASEYIVLITGDIVENANHFEQTEAALRAISKLENYGLKVLVIPGNHDYGNGALANTEFVSRFKEKYYKNAEISYPKLDIIDDIAFIGLDSTAEELHWLDRILSEGELGKEQRNRLKRILNEPEIINKKKVVYLHHHPFDYKFGMHLKDSKSLKKCIEHKVDLILFGHYHNNSKSAGKNFHGRWGITRCYNAGSSTHKNGNTGVHRIIDLSNENPSSDFEGNFI